MAAKRPTNRQVIVVAGAIAVILIVITGVTYLIATHNSSSLPDITATDLPSSIPPAQRAQPTAFPLTLSKETTAITSPLLPDGTPDYITALNRLHSQDVTPENNALIPLLRIRGTDSLDPNIRSKFLEIIGAEPTPSDARIFLTLSDYLKSG